MPKYIFIIAALCFAVYANTLHNDFVSDDLPTIVNNPEISRPFAAVNAASISNSLNYLAGGLNTLGYHLVNIILHAVNAVMVFYLLCLFFRAAPSFWGALIFAAQPVNSEAVTWISGRLYLLFTFFLLSAFLIYVRATQGDCFGRLRRPRNDDKKGDCPLPLDWARGKRGQSPFLSFFLLLISLILYICALTASFFPLVFPAMIALYDITFGRWRRTWKYWLPFFVIAAAKLVLMFSSVQNRVVEIAMESGITAWSNPFYNTVYSNFAHLRLLIWPQKLTIYHEPSVISRWALNTEIFFFAILILSLPYLFKKAKPLFFAACVYILFLAPAYSPKMIAWLVAERYLYFPSIGFSIFTAFFIDRYAQSGKLKAIIYIFLAVLIMAYSARTIIRNRDWRTHASLWRATAKISPQSPKAHNNMGDVYSLEGNFVKAEEEFRKSTELKPDYAEAYHNLAFTYGKMGRIDEAILAYQQAVKFKPQLYQSHTNLAAIYLNRGQKDLAKYHLEQAHKFNPQDEGIKRLLGQMN